MLFYVESPFQLLQAYEFIGVHDLKSYEIILRCNSNSINNNQIQNLYDELNLKNAYKIDCYSKLTCLKLSVHLLYRSIFNEKILIGDENSKVFKLIKILVSTNKVMLMDDGVATINRKSENDKYQRFSLFAQGSNVQVNNFNYLSRYIGKSHSQKKVNIIIGSKLVEECICTQSAYINAIKFMKMNVDISIPTLYIPHRGELDTNLEKIKNDLELKVAHTKLPVEMIGLELNVDPVNIFSVISTALFSMKLIYKKSNIVLFRINDDDLNERKESIVRFYNYVSESDELNISHL